MSDQKRTMTTAFGRPVENWTKIHPDFGAAVARGIGLAPQRLAAE